MVLNIMKNMKLFAAILSLAVLSGCAARIVEIEPPQKSVGESTLSKQIKFGLRGMALIELKQQGFDRVVEFGFSFRPNESIKKSR